MACCSGCCQPASQSTDVPASTEVPAPAEDGASQCSDGCCDLPAAATKNGSCCDLPLSSAKTDGSCNFPTASIQSESCCNAPNDDGNNNNRGGVPDDTSADGCCDDLSGGAQALCCSGASESGANTDGRCDVADGANAGGCCTVPCGGGKGSIECAASNCQINNDGISDSCCTDDPEPCMDSCCRSKKQETVESTAVGGCETDAGRCSPDSVGIGPPVCCTGKAFPCCDEKCLDELALHECQKSLPNDMSSNASFISGCDGGKNGTPCKAHSKRTRTQYGEKLEALGCICRTLLQLGMESCCDLKSRSGGRAGRAGGKRASSFATRSRDGGIGIRRDKRSVPKPPCDSLDGPKYTCCGSGQGQKDACCLAPGPGKLSTSKMTRGNTPKATVYGVDPEKGLSSSDVEHVVLGISGMTCTGCETKLIRTLGTLPSVKNLKTSLVLSRAEFDLTGASATDVTRHIERTTEFKCKRLRTQGSSLEFTVPEQTTPVKVAEDKWPDGVLDVTPTGPHSVLVGFNPDIIGGRELAQHNWSCGHLDLAAACPNPSLTAGKSHVRNIGYATIASAMLTIPVLVMSWASLPENELAYNSASLALATIVQFAIAGPFYPKALKALVFSSVIEMDLLIVLSTSAAYIFSVVSFAYSVCGNPLATGTFFETSTLLVTLIMVGRYVSALARQKAVESISMQSLQPSTACLVTEHGVTDIDARLLQYGDLLRVLPQTKVPTDGVVLSGMSEVDESMVTGEAIPVAKITGSNVLAGSMNGSGVLTVRLSRLPCDNTISVMAAMVDAAKLSKPTVQNIADKVASYFVPAVVLLTTITFIVWLVIGLKVRGQSGSESAVQALTYAMTILIVSCPCAIGLAVPMVIVITSGVSAERGVIFASAETIEVAHKTSHVVFDKTGTLTEGKLSVAESVYIGGDDDAVKGLLLGLLDNSKHPVSEAVSLHLASQKVAALPVAGIAVVAGKGIEGTTSQGSRLRAGNSRWLNSSDNTMVQSLSGQGLTLLCFELNGTLRAIFGLRDTLRDDALATVSGLVQEGIQVHILSGDEDKAVKIVAGQLSIPESNVRSKCSPETKQAYLKDLLGRVEKRRGYMSKFTMANEADKGPVVMFCGDGTNDAVAIAQATIGVHMNHDSAAEVAKSAADVVLMRPNLAGIATVIKMSKVAMRRVAFNFGWSFVYNLLAITLGSGAFVVARIPPKFAGIGEIVSVLPVIAAAVLIRWTKV